MIDGEPGVVKPASLADISSEVQMRAYLMAQRRGLNVDLNTGIVRAPEQPKQGIPARGSINNFRGGRRRR